MTKSITRLLILLAGSLLTTGLYGQSTKYTLSGKVTDISGGEPLVGASVTLRDGRTGTVTGADGSYSFLVPAGRQTVTFSYIGFVNSRVEVDLRADTVVNISLTASENRLGDVVVQAEGANANVTRSGMGIEKLTAERIRSIPALMGEVDVLKAIQLLPGVQSNSEGNTGFSVRGGSHDQNLIMLDEATVYNASHLMGFFSVFNNDVIRDVTLYKGDIPATFGGRLSSMVDVRTKEHAGGKINGVGGIGLIASRLTLEGPLAKERLSFLVSGRRTYADLFLKLAPDEDLRKSVLHFYDANAKLNWTLGRRDRIFASAYLGRDKFGVKFAGMDFGNQTFSVRWNHIFSEKLMTNVTLLGSGYDYYLKADIDDDLKQSWKSDMKDYGVKADLLWNFNENNALRFGYSGVLHNFRPGEGGGDGDDPLLKNVILPRQYALEQAVYVSNETSLGKLKLKYGLRFSMFSNMGNGEEITYLENYEPSRTETHAKGRIYNTMHHFEPRAGALWMFDERHSVKASYARMAQYIQLASNSAAGSPLDVWFQSSQNIKPQVSDQYSIGYFRNFKDNAYEASVEFYYRDMQNAIDFKDHAELFVNPDLDQQVRFGRGYAYGAEFMLRKNSGKLNGWISYTYARSYRQTDAINDGKWYRSNYDKPHNISIVANYDTGNKWSFAANWVYSTGTPSTFPIGYMMVQWGKVPVYGDRNAHRYPDYHRLDLSAAVKISHPARRVQSELNFSLYNAYGRKNPWTIMFKQDKNNGDRTYAEQIYLFSIVPSITWNFKF